MSNTISSLPERSLIPHPQPISVQNRWCCISLLSGCVSVLKDLVNKVIEVAQSLWTLISLVFRCLRSRCWYGVHVPFSFPDGASLDTSHVVNYFARQFRVPVEMSPQVGMDPRISPAQFTQTLSAQVEVPEAPDVDIRGLPPLFAQLVAPNDDRIEDEDTPATFEQLNQGLNFFVQTALAGHFMYGTHRVTLLHNGDMQTLFKHIFSLLLKEDISREDKIESLLELARAGHRKCPTRMHESVQVVYERLKGEIAIQTLPDLVAKQLHDLRGGILKEMSGGSVHLHQEYLASIGQPLGIRHASMAYNDDPILMDRCAPRRAFPLFFGKYTPEKIIETLSTALNGFQRTGRPAHERTERKLPLDVAVGWFLENIPAHFHPEQALDERKALYAESILDPQTNTLKRDAVLYMLVRLGVLRS